jgi:hypothetical protein
VRRSAQDDGFVGVLKKTFPNKSALKGRRLGLAGSAVLIL